MKGQKRRILGSGDKGVAPSVLKWDVEDRGELLLPGVRSLPTGGVYGAKWEPKLRDKGMGATPKNDGGVRKLKAESVTVENTSGEETDSSN